MRNRALKTREIEPDVYLPFGRHVTDTVISLTTRALLTVIRIDGTSFETAETSDLNDLHAKLNLRHWPRQPSSVNDDDRLFLISTHYRGPSWGPAAGANRSRFMTSPLKHSATLLCIVAVLSIAFAEPALGADREHLGRAPEHCLHVDRQRRSPAGDAGGHHRRHRLDVRLPRSTQAAYVVLGVAITFGASEVVSTLTGGH